MLNRCVRSSFVLVAMAIAAACAQGSGQPSPLGPSAVLPDASVVSGGWATTSASRPGTDRGLVSAQARGHKSVSGVGTVANLRGSCKPTGSQEPVSFVVQGVKIVTDENTEFFFDAEEAIEGGCGNLRNGTKVRVVAAATANADFSYTAETITIVDQPGGPPPTPVAGDGVVAALKGECPALTMVVHGYPVMTTSSTAFEGGACEAIGPGTRVHVEGVLGGNSVVADVVKTLATVP
jgi:Domain of unknown function (DUF5666)